MRGIVRLEELRTWLTPRQAGEILGISGQWAKVLTKRGDLHGVDTALGWLIEPKSLDKYYEQRLEALEERMKRMKEKRYEPQKRRGRSKADVLKQKDRDWTIENHEANDKTGGRA